MIIIVIMIIMSGYTTISVKKEVKTHNAFIKAGVGHSSHETMMREYRYEDMKKAYKIVFGGD